ncbi:glycerophosphodiester phosphodiesterase [Thermophagus sp. OGC60D27]|uniref:glycerophosphodiester phosphodiesterase n=1 Tax=Thermophagus sp. OGC60D27 TaxID=3458415 RepID=UPI004037F76B
MKEGALIFLLVFMFSAWHHNQVEVIAHRGASGAETENTLKAVKKAIELNSDAVEVDIWRTIDDSLIVFHDRHTARLSDDSLIVPESVFSDLRKITLKENERIPTLREVLDILPPNIKLFVEIKCCWEQGKAGEVFPMLSDLLKETGKADQVVIISFNPAKLVEASTFLPEVPKYWLVWENRPVDELIEAALSYGVNGLNINYSLLSDELLDKASKNNLDIYIWTVNDTVMANEVLDEFDGIKGITTDRPDLMKQLVNQK